MASDPRAFKYASEALLAKPKVAMLAIASDISNFDHVHGTLYDDKGLGLLAVGLQPDAFALLSTRLQADTDIRQSARLTRMEECGVAVQVRWNMGGVSPGMEEALRDTGFLPLRRAADEAREVEQVENPHPYLA